MTLNVEAPPLTAIEGLLNLPEAEIPTAMEIGSLEKSRDVWKAIELVDAGEIVAFEFRSVFGLMVDAWNEQAAISALDVKGTENIETKPLSAMMSSLDFLPLVDKSVLSDSMRVLVEDPDEFQRRIGALCHISAPIRAEAVKKEEIPDRLLSFNSETGQYYMHNLDPEGHGPMSGFIRRLNKAGLHFPGVTAIGRSGEPEFVEKEKAMAFCQKSNQVSLFLEDPNPAHEKVLGSFPILDIEQECFVRDGHVPAQIVSLLIHGVELSAEGMEPAFYEQASFFFEKSLMFLSPDELRLELLRIMDGL